MLELSSNVQTKNYNWLIKLVAENYAVGVRGEPILLNQRDQQRVFRLNTSEGTALTLRLCPPSHSYEQVQADTEALLYLSRQHYPAPTLRLTRTAQPAFEWQTSSWAYAHDFIEGKQPEWNLATLEEVAKLLGRLHLLNDNTQPFPTKVNWLDDLNQVIERTESCTNHVIWGQPAREVATILSSLPSLALQDLPNGIMHGDVHEGNLLRNPAGQLFLLDWEHAGIGPLLLDLALVLGWHCLWPASKSQNLSGEPIHLASEIDKFDFDFDEEWCKTFLATYQQFRPLTSQEVQYLAVAIRFVIGWYAVRDIEIEVKEAGASDGLALFHWSIIHSLTPTREQRLKQWAIETGVQTRE